MINAIKVIWDAILTLAGYAVLAVIFVILIAVSPIIVVISACMDGVKLSEALSDYMHSFVKTFYETFNK